MADTRICSVEGCGKPVRARGWCPVHYMRWLQNGDPTISFFEKNGCLRWLREVAVTFSKNECLEWPFERSAKGYGRVRSEGRRRGAHRVVCEIVHGPAPSPDYDAAHSCGNGHLGCVNPLHLRWATRQDNILEKNIHGTMARGSRNGNASMDEATARKAKRMIGTMTQREIAERLGITRSAVRDIKTGKTWKWL